MTQTKITSKTKDTSNSNKAKAKPKKINADADKSKDSPAYKAAKTKAEEYARDPEKLNNLLEKASTKANEKKGPLEVVWVQLTASFRLLKAYSKGKYRDIPWSSLLMLVASVIYFVMPFDVIPEFIVGIGLLDDATILGWTFRSLSSDIDDFLAWEKQNATC